MTDSSDPPTPSAPTTSPANKPMSWLPGLITVLLSAAALCVSFFGVILPDQRAASLAADNAESAQTAALQAEADRAVQDRQAEAMEGLKDAVSDQLDGSLPELTPPSAAGAEVADQEMCREGGRPLTAGWGPNRPIFSVSDLPTYPALNSIRDSGIGDERSFYGIRDAASQERVWYNTIEVVPGHTYRLRVYVHNAAGVANAVAEHALVKINLPTCMGTSIQSNAFVSSPDAFPSEVYSSLVMNASQRFNLAYVENSARVENQSANSPLNIAAAESGLFTTAGQPIGFDELKGELGAGYENDLFLTFEIRPQFAE